MDNLTHSLFAVTLARTPLSRAGRGTAAALLLASNAPDIDAVSITGGTVSYLQWHRGPTHGLLALPLLAVAVALAVSAGRRIVDRRRKRPADDGGRGDASLAMLTAVSAIGVAGHLLMDLPTSYGTRLLSPLGWRWFALDWLPIIDIYLLMILIAGLIVTAMAPDARRRVASTVLVLMAVNYGVRAAAHHQALTLAPRLFGPVVSERCDPSVPAVQQSWLDSWPRETTQPSPGGRPCLVEIAAMPTLASPFRWRVIARLSNAYELHEVDLLDQRFRAAEAQQAFWRVTVRVPNVWTPAATTAADTRVGRVFLGFSRFPATRSLPTSRGGEAIVRWNDVRFAGGMFSLNGARPPAPFTATIHVGPDGRVTQQQIAW